MNLEPLLTASAVITIHTTNNVAYKTVKRLSAKISLFPPNFKSANESLNLRSLSILLAADNLFPFCGLPSVLITSLTDLNLNDLETST